MIVCQVNLLCDGCGRSLRPADPPLLRPPFAVIAAARNLLSAAQFAHWTIDGPSHWCPQCVINIARPA
jgi:hypothetical protein